MHDLSKIHILDQVGLDNAAIENSILAKTDIFCYHAPSTVDSTVNLLSEKADEVGACLYLTDILTLHRVVKSVPKSLDKKTSFAVIATSHEMDDIDDCSKMLDEESVVDILESPITPTRLNVLLRRAQLHFKNKGNIDALHQELVEQRDELKMLNDIGIALSSERDIANLLEMILAISMDITNADAGSLYIVEEVPGIPYEKQNYFNNKQLRFRHTKNFSKDVPFKEFTMPISPKSIAGYVALSGLPLNLPDVYQIPQDVPYGWGGRKFDEESGYRTMSMLVVPMLNRDKETIGVIQLINKKREEQVKLVDVAMALEMVIPFNKADEDFIYSLASQAAVAYENQRLYDSIRTLFEGFIKASVTAIEARDPTTSGHSERVAVLTVGLAEAVDRIGNGPYKSVNFSRRDIQEIQYASLLHDFGKIGVREPVLVKAKKLYDYERQAIENRYNILKKAIELDASRKKIEYLLHKSHEEAFGLVSELDKETYEKIAELDEFLQFILRANEPTILHSEGFEKLREIKTRVFTFGQNEVYPYLTDEEAARLMIPKGSLDEQERLQIESHVTHTYNFLKQIPWTNDLRNVPEIAYAHHEKLDGTGYPLKKSLKTIPVQAKMMTISDIFDALTAQDRPYKKSVPAERALDILSYEVKEKKIDKDLYQIFIDAKIFDLVNSKDQ
ncbi:MAG: GAF domain-containing protein [Chlorobiales bacterium]|nr:GAF domain-containing protein [Chlorobiales bacterium]